MISDGSGVDANAHVFPGRQVALLVTGVAAAEQVSTLRAVGAGKEADASRRFGVGADGSLRAILLDLAVRGAKTTGEALDATTTRAILIRRAPLLDDLCRWHRRRILTTSDSAKREHGAPEKKDDGVTV